jgi:carbon monoxide dehydrogenase subunit G
MEFENSFSVKAPIADVWAALLDIERAPPCFPGARVLERKGEDEYTVAMRVKVSPMTMEYQGTLEVRETHPEEHRAVLGGTVRDLRGQGAAEAQAEMRLSEVGGQTVASIKTDVKLSGRVAAMGQGVIGDVAKRLVDTFSTNLSNILLAPAAPATPAAAGSDPSSDPVPTPDPSPAPAEMASLPLISVLGAALLERLRKTPALVGIVAALAGVLLWRRHRRR